MSQGYAGDLTPAEAWALLEREPAAEMIDVRTDAEWVFVGRPDLAALGKQVRFVPWLFFPGGRQNADFTQQIEASGLSKNQTLLFICRSGQRSAFAAAAFEGDHDAEGHRGRLGGWKVAGLAWVQD
jgi:rhodanese-related sulfurtransferase